MHPMVKCPHGDAWSQKPFLFIGFGHFSNDQRGLANFKVPTNYAMRLWPYCVLANWLLMTTHSKLKVGFSKAGQLKDMKTT